MRRALAERPHAVRVGIALGLVYVVWGSTYLAIKVAVETLPPLSSAGIRFMIAGAALYAFMIRRTPPEERPTRAQWRSAAIVGGALLVGGNGGVVLSESWGTPSGIAALLVGTVPLWLALLSFVFLRDRLSVLSTVGILTGFAGVAVLARPSGQFAWSGSVVIIGAALAWSAGSLYARSAPLPKSPLLATSLEMLAGGALQVVAGAAMGEMGEWDFGAISGRSLVALVYLIVVGALVGFTSYIYVLSNAPTSVAGTYAYVNPVIAVVLGAVILNETITTHDAIAGAIIVASVALIVTGARGRAGPAPEPATLSTPEPSSEDSPSVEGGIRSP
ncbi:MAG: EamA family transporter [Actinomycetota bacterium]